MLTLGALGGAYWTLGDDGAVSSLTLQPYGISLAVADRPAAAVTRTKRPGPAFPAGGESPSAAYELETHGRQVVQLLSGGQRAWEIYQGRDDRRDAVLAWTAVTHTLESAATWRLTFHDCMKLVKQTGDAGDSGASITLECTTGATIQLTGAAPMTYQTLAANGEITGAEVAVQLPAGESRLEIVVEAWPPYDLADTVVLCLPQQLGEAAVVATCVRGKAANRGKYVPVIDVLNPPAAAEEARNASQGLQAAMKEYQDVEAEIMRLAGAAPSATPARSGTDPAHRRRGSLRGQDEGAGQTPAGAAEDSERAAGEGAGLRRLAAPLGAGDPPGELPAPVPGGLPVPCAA